ncbi:hypothetical protein C8T65DRAFT_703939, partial [Cerioporus squamosus]
AYTIASTAIVPLVGDLVSGFSRKPVLLTFVLTFALGSAVSGAAQNMNMLIAGRAIQGFGGGRCLAVTEIVYADLVPLPERGKFQDIVVSIGADKDGAALQGMGDWLVPTAVAVPTIANSGAWRWLFFLNLPLCGIAMMLTSVFLKVRAPKSSLKEKLRQMDWIGITIIVGSTVSLALAFTWGGLTFPWDSANVLSPMIIGAVGIAFFLIAEKYWIKGATVPRYFFTSPTTLSGYMGTFFHGIISLAAICISVKALKKYRPQNYIEWAITLIGFGVITRLDADSTRAQYICSQIPRGIGLGIVWSWGIIIGGTILQNILLKDLPPSYVAMLPQGVQLAYAIILDIRGLDPDLRRDVQVAFANATQVIWKTMLGIAGVGVLTETLRESLDEQWGLKDKDEKGLESDPEKVLGSEEKIAGGGSQEVNGAVAGS